MTHKVLSHQSWLVNVSHCQQVTARGARSRPESLNEYNETKLAFLIDMFPRG